jgi:hypothetical protein
MSQFVKTEIILPETLECFGGSDSSHAEDLNLNSCKFIVYYDSLDCSSCRISHLADLYPLYNMADTCDFSVVTIFSPRHEDLENVRVELFRLQPIVPIYVDSYGEFANLNKSIPSDIRFHCFLLDEKNKPKFIGNPLFNQELMELFIQALGD